MAQAFTKEHGAARYLFVVRQLPVKMEECALSYIFGSLSFAQNAVDLFLFIKPLTECKERRLVVIVNVVGIQMLEELAHCVSVQYLVLMIKHEINLKM